MSEQADLALKEALAKARALNMFPITQAALLAVSLILLIFVIKRHVDLKGGKPLSPMRFLFFSFFILGLGGALSVYWGIYTAVFAVAFATGLAMSLVDPMAAVCFLLANTLLRGWEMTGSTEMSIIPKTMGLLALGSWIFYGIRSGTLSLLFNWPSRFFFAFSLWVLASAVTHDEFMAGLQAYNNTMMVATILFVLVANAPKSQSDLRLVENTLVVAITGVIAHALFVTISQDGFDPSQHRLEDIGLTGNSNDLAALVVQALPIAVIPALSGGKGGLTRMIAILCVPILLVGLWLAQSRGALMAVALSAFAYLTLRARNPKRALIAAGVCLPFLIGLVSIMNFARNAQDLQGSSESRMSFMIAGLKMALHNPIMGVGYANFPKLYESFADGALTYEWGQRTAHSTWILALAETGGTGFLLFFGAFASTFKRAWRVRRSHPELFSALLGYTVAMSFLSHTYTIFPYLLFALVLAAAKLTKTPDAAAQSPSGGKAA